MVNDIFLENYASYCAAILASCTVFQKPHNMVHCGVLEFAVHHGGYMVGGQSDYFHTIQILVRNMMHNPVADLQGVQNSDIRGPIDNNSSAESIGSA